MLYKYLTDAESSQRTERLSGSGWADYGTQAVGHGRGLRDATNSGLKGGPVVGRLSTRSEKERCVLGSGKVMGKSRFLFWATTAALFACLTACASVPQDPIEREVFLEANDPLEPLNRAVFAFNMGVDRAVLEPAAIAYRNVVPKPGRVAITRLLSNLKLPITFVNDLLQLEFGRATNTFARFLVNSTVGVGGLFNVVGTREHQEDLGQTLGRWGVGNGFYVVLPLYGPSNVRDAMGLVGDTFLNPWQSVLDPTQSRAFHGARGVAGVVNDRERRIEDFNDIRRRSLDMYATFRSMYRQTRGNEIRNGAPPPDTVFGFD